MIERSAMARRGPDGVLRRLGRPDTWPKWQAEILTTRGPQELSDGDVVRGRARMLGFEVDGQTIISHAGDESFQQDVVVGVGMRIEYRLREVAGGVEITHRLTSDLPSGPAGRVLSFFLRRRLRRMQRELLRALVAQVEGS